MGIFDRLEKRNEHLTPEQYQEKRQKEIDRLESMYDLSTVVGINAIPIPTKKETYSGIDVTGKIEYYLMLKAGGYEKSNQVELALACYRKANELMPFSSTSYPYETYMRLPKYLRKLRRFDEARQEEAKISSLFGGKNRFIELTNWTETRNSKLFHDMLLFRTDLVEASYIRCCCAECAKYRERIYSLSGNDKRFPKLPALLLSNHDCGIQLAPFIYGANTLRTRYGKDLSGIYLINYSNRPFVDDRTAEELSDIKAIQQQQKAELAIENNHADYDWLWEFLPEYCPKSFSAYMRMKNANTEKYQMLVEEAKKRGYKFK